MSWDVDPENPASNHLIVNDIGLHTWEEVNIIHAGGNYGYSAREGNEQLISNFVTGPVPSPDLIPVYISNIPTGDTVTPLYPVAQYGHGLSGQSGPAGDAITSGFVYRGSNLPALYGKYIFGDVTTGQLMWCDFDEMLAADDGDPATLATIHSFDVLWDNPNDVAGEQLYTVANPSGAVLGPMHQIVEQGYEARGGTDPNLPGGAVGDRLLRPARISASRSTKRASCSFSRRATAWFATSLERSSRETSISMATSTAATFWSGNAIPAVGDLSDWQANYGAGSLIAAVSVPEPTSIAFLCIGWLFFAFNRRKVNLQSSIGN